MSWLRKAIWAWREGRDEGRGVKIRSDLERLCSMAQRTLPASSMKQFGVKIAGYLREAWEEGKPLQPKHVPQYGLSLYSREYLERKIQDFWARGVKLEEQHDVASKLDAYAMYIAAYYLSAMMLEEGPATHVDRLGLPVPGPIWTVKNRVKALCDGVADPFPNFR